MNFDFVVIALYMIAMVAVGWWAKGRAKSEADFLVAGRRLGPVLYAGTMAALVMGGGATIGGIGRGYTYGISGMWLAFALGMGVFVVSLTLAPLVSRLKVYTVSQMLELRYGPGTSVLSGAVMLGYAFMIAVTSTIAYGAIFEVLFGLTKVPAVLIGGGVVVLYSVLGGMWSITLTDFFQFVIKTVGLMFILLPAALLSAGGFEGLHAKLPESAFSFTTIGWGRIVTFFIIFNLSIVVGQDVWQRIFTARSPQVAKWAGAAAGVYCFAYAACGAVIGMAARVVLPENTPTDKVYAEIVQHSLPPGLAGLVIAAALAAIMSVSSGTLIASATVAKEDIVRVLKHRGLEIPADETGENRDEVRDSRWYILGFGLLMIGMAAVLQDVVTALTIGSAIVVTGLFVPIIGGMIWKRGTIKGATASIIAGILFTFGDMAYLKNIDADEPIYVGMIGSLIAYVIVSLMTQPTAPAIMAEWVRRSKGKA
ncbi:MAG: sodium:solute symporter family protein [Rhodospirillaceae bacterium]